MKILHTISGIWEHTGGPAESVPKLCQTIVKSGASVTLATLEGHLSSSALECERSGVEVKTFPHFIREFSPSFARSIKALCAEVDIIHSHALWTHVNWVTGQRAKELGKPLIITPRGSLKPTALKHSYCKKKIAGTLFDKPLLKYASCIHATSVMEYDSIRSYGLTNPVAIIPNGVDLPQELSDVEGAWLSDKYPEVRGKRIILFLSRLSWEKGVPMLLDSWEQLYTNFPDWYLVIAGTGEKNYVRKLKNICTQKGISKNVTWTGILHGNEKAAAYAVADLFILPTHSENFGIVIAEAMAAKTPVITTKGAPWEEILLHNCGWWIPINTDSLIEAMGKALTSQPASLKEKGINGQKLVKENYSWDFVGNEMLNVYEWILHGGLTPKSVRLD